MNNNFVVQIPTNLKKIKSKLFLGLTKRQSIGLVILLIVGLPIFYFLKGFGTETAMWGLLLIASPVIFGTIYSKDNLPSETWIKLFINYKKIYPSKKQLHFSKNNLEVAYQRGLLKK